MTCYNIKIKYAIQRHYKTQIAIQKLYRDYILAQNWFKYIFTCLTCSKNIFIYALITTLNNLFDLKKEFKLL